MSAIDVTKSKWRADFPLLSRKFNGKNLAYFDSAATTLKPWAVIERVGHFLTYETANVHRGAYFLSNQATENFENARSTVARFLGAQPNEIIFTSGTTDSMNLVAQTLGATILKAGDEILVTEMEHHSGIVPWQLIAEKTHAKIVAVPVQSSGDLLLADFERLISAKTKIVSVVHCSNTIGTINDVKKIASIAHSVGAKIVVDGAQMVAIHPVNVKDLDVDFYAFSGHKIYGPYGIGVLFGRAKILEALPPYRGGGSMISEVKIEHTTFHDVPYRFEAGTPNIEGVLGLAAAIEYLSKQAWTEVISFEKALREELLAELVKIEGVRVIGDSSAERGPTISFLLEGTHPSDVGDVLNRENVAVRAGHHCTQPLMARLGLTATVRASISLYNQRSDLEQLVLAIKKAREILL